MERVQGVPFFENLKQYVGFTEESSAALRELRPLALPDFGWIVDDFYPRLARNGVRYVAFVVGEKTLLGIHVRRLSKSFDKGSLEFQYHATRAEAAAWLATHAT